MESEELTTRLSSLGIDPNEPVVDESSAIGTMTVNATTLVRSGASMPPPSVANLPRIDLGAPGSDLVELGVLAEGGMGRILHARQTALGRDVAIKTPKDGASTIEVDSILREAFVGGELEHPSVVPVYALGADAHGNPLLVMRKVEGITWSELLSEPENPAWETHVAAGGDRLEANIDILIAICRALEFAHLRGFVHRDVKPNNVMLGRFGEVYLFDWGLAVPAGSVPGLGGTPGYMAPEMVSNKGVIEATTDVYLLGATLHRIVTGTTRHRAESIAGILMAATKSSPFDYDASVPAPLATLCNRACAAAKEHRPPSVTVFREALLEYKRHKSARAIADVARQRLAELERKLAETESIAPSDLAVAYRLVTEARFGFAQALAQHPDDAATKAGAAHAVACLVELELRQDHVDTAAALLDEFPVAAAAFAPRVAAARLARKAKAEEHARLQAMDRDLDPAVGRRARAALLSAIVLFAIFVSGLVLTEWGRAFVPSRRGVIVVGAAPLVIIALGVLAARRHVLPNAFSRRLVGVVGGMQLAVVVHRIIALRRGYSLGEIFAGDLLLGALCATSVAVCLIPRVGLVAPVMLGAIAWMELQPEYAHLVFPVAVAIGFAIPVFVIWRDRRR